MGEGTTKPNAHTAVVVHSPVGPLTVVANSNSLIGLFWPDQRMRNHFPSWESTKQIDQLDPGEHTVLIRAKQELEEYFSGQRVTFEVPLSPDGNQLQQSVWNYLRGIPHGVTVTYGEIARALGNPRLAQLVGQAVGANPIALIIPCHRVLGRDGSLTGFSRGLERKRWLLQFEDPGSGIDGRLF